jgi:hypothetical protein
MDGWLGYVGEGGINTFCLSDEPQPAAVRKQTAKKAYHTIFFMFLLYWKSFQIKGFSALLLKTCQKKQEMWREH